MTDLTLSAALKLWRGHGGNTFGPHVEHVSMKEADFLGFCTDLISREAASPPSPAVVPPDLRTLVPGFRLDWSGLRNRFEDAALRLEKLITYESRAAHLDEMAREFEDAVTKALSASPSPPALDGAGRDAVIEEIAKHFDRVSEEAEAQSVFAIYREIASEVRSLKETP